MHRKAIVDAISAGVTQAAQRDSGKLGVDDLRYRLGDLGHRGVDDAGHHRIDTDVARRPLDREVVGEAGDAGLGRAVAGHHGHRPQRRQGRQVDHACAAGGGRGGQRLHAVRRSIGRAPVRLSATDASNPSGSASLSPPGKFAPALLTSTSSVLVAETNSSDRAVVGQDESSIRHPGEVGVVVAGLRPGAGDGHGGAGIAEECRGRVADSAGAAGDERARCR